MRNDQTKSELLKIKDLHVAYQTGRATTCALNGVDLSIARGEAIGLVGETGAGKTTTALSILGLLPKRVSKVKRGEVIFDGESILDMSERKLGTIRGNRISMIFQNPLTSLNPVFTIEEQISMVYRRHRHMNKKEARELCIELLETVGIERSRLSDYPNQLSGGMRQRIGIAAALAGDPELLIADEPTTALDVTIQAQILELMKAMQTQRESSLLMITHNLGIISELCEKVAVMYGGRIVELGTVKEVYSNPQHPYTRGLFGSIPKLTGPRERLVSIPGAMVSVDHEITGCAFADRCTHAKGICKGQRPSMRLVSGEHFVECWDSEGVCDGK